MSAGVEALAPPQPVLDPVTPGPYINSINPAEEPFLRFPPFPPPPPGVTIMPFKDFKERGIAVRPGPDDAEVDALGIPTLPLRVVHSTDVCKTDTKRKRKAEQNKARKKGGAGAKNVPWFEEWEEAEAARFSTGFNPNSSRFERIQAAATDFTNSRKWPLNYASETGPKFIFDKFLRYIGLPEGGPLPEERKKSKKAQEEAEEISDDDTDGEEEHEDAEPNAQEHSMAGIIMDRHAPAKLQLSSNEEKLLTFFHNPEKSIRIFLSSHARLMGFVWSDPNLDCMGRILKFFVNFALRSKVLPESERSLRRSLEVIEKAKKELPNTSAIAKVFPDIFSRACSACWGWKAEGYAVLSLDNDIQMESKIDEVKEETAPVENASGWGSQPSWGAVEGSAWGTSVTDVNSSWGASVIPESVPEASPWEAVKEDSLLSLLGPTALPLTHTTGIVEQSMRRIKTITPLPQNPPKSPPQPEGVFEPDAAAVELELDRNFIKVVLEPMPVDWDGGEVLAYSSPKILNTSQGPVADPNAAEPTPKAHDPFKDEIALLIEPKDETVALLSVGMGLGGTWVQIVREGEPVKKKKKGKSKSKGVPTYWYIDGLSVVIPSFWTIKS